MFWKCDSLKGRFFIPHRKARKDISSKTWVDEYRKATIIVSWFGKLNSKTIKNEWKLVDKNDWLQWKSDCKMWIKQSACIQNKSLKAPSNLLPHQKMPRWWWRQVHLESAFRLITLATAAERFFSTNEGSSRVLITCSSAHDVALQQMTFPIHTCCFRSS